MSGIPPSPYRSTRRGPVWSKYRPASEAKRGWDYYRITEQGEIDLRECLYTARGSAAGVAQIRERTGADVVYDFATNFDDRESAEVNSPLDRVWRIAEGLSERMVMLDSQTGVHLVSNAPETPAPVRAVGATLECIEPIQFADATMPVGEYVRRLDPNETERRGGQFTGGLVDDVERDVDTRPPREWIVVEWRGARRRVPMRAFKHVR